MGIVAGLVEGLTGVGKWILRNPSAVAVAMLTAAFGIVIVSKNSEIKTLSRVSSEKDERITNLMGSLAQARTNVRTLNQTLIQQSQSILALKAQGDASLTKFDTIIAGQALANTTISKKIAVLDAARPGADKCQSAFDLVRSTVQ